MTLPGGILLQPAFALWLMLGLLMVAVLAGVFLLWKRAKGAWWRIGTAAGLLLLLTGLLYLEEDRDPVKDTALVVIDRSASQSLANREAQTTKTKKALQRQLRMMKALEVKTLTLGEESQQEGTQLFGPVREALQALDPERFAGMILVTDGQVTDVDVAPEEIPGPVHVLLTGTRGEFDRRVEVVRAPSFGIVGEEVAVDIRVTDHGISRDLPAAVTISGGPEVVEKVVIPGEASRIVLPVVHPGANIFKISAEPVGGELTERNNRRFVTINGVRDRLRVLLVSGKANIGQRSWRNILKSDPAIDLVHFTILRTPDKLDATPISQLSLIPFPVHELFYEKLDGFDLVIFESFENKGLLPFNYFKNIAKYIREGGALLHVAGPAYAVGRGLSVTPLQQSLPASPGGKVVEQSFVPVLSETGFRHPVTAEMGRWYVQGKPSWSPWFRQIPAQIDSGAQILMEGGQTRPLLALSRIGEGRAAQLLSDQLWLWGRGYEGGGPYGELIRRMIHWLMKEPDLEENALKAKVGPGFFTVERRSLEPGGGSVQVTSPSGRTFRVDIDENVYGIGKAKVEAKEEGIYAIEDGELRTTVAIGAVNAVELAEVVATEDKLLPVVRKSGGDIRWLEDGMPEIRKTDAGGRAYGRDWLGLKDNDAYVVKGLTQRPLIPYYFWLLLLLTALVMTWRAEGGK